MPRGTRLATLCAFVLVACLFAWRANSFLTDQHFHAEAMTPAQLHLTGLLEPMFGEGNVRVASHTASDGTTSYLVLVNRHDAPFQLDPSLNTDIAAILEAAAGYDASIDRLQVQPLAFAPGYGSGFASNELIELAALFGVAGLLAFLLVQSLRGEPALPAVPEPKAANDGAIIRAMPLGEVPANEDRTAEAQRIARENPKEAARILRSWMTSGKDGPK